VNAMQDAVLLANHIYDIHPTSHKNVETALSDYKDERFNTIKDQYPVSHMSAKLIFGHVNWHPSVNNKCSGRKVKSCKILTENVPFLLVPDCEFVNRHFWRGF
jgi:hypothetical protein